jgi:hypothetical protein
MRARLDGGWGGEGRGDRCDGLCDFWHGWGIPTGVRYSKWRDNVSRVSKEIFEAVSSIQGYNGIYQLLFSNRLGWGNKI